VLLVASALFGIGATAAAAAGEQFRGALDLTLTPYTSTTVLLTRVSQAPAGVEIRSDDALFGGALKWLTGRSGEFQMRVLLVERQRMTWPFVYIDLDRNGRFSRDERFSFSQHRRPYLLARLTATAPPLPNTPFRHIPIELFLPNSKLPIKASADERYLVYSSDFLVTAKVTIDRRRLFFRYSVSLDGTDVDPNHGYQAVDAGRLATGTLSPRRGHARGKALVFRIGDRYVSTAEVDLRRRTVVIETREPHEYARLELWPGLALPDFSFEDLRGRTRRLSEFRGRYVLLNFWYHGCSPCEDEFPYLQDAHERFAPRGLTIVGLSQTSVAPPPTFVPPDESTWVEAAPRSVSALIQEWFRIDSTPIQVLLDPNGRIVMTGEMVDGRQPLRGDELRKTLDDVFRR
jgi:thiol-disulfide isomerase/thioredoxin